MSQKVSKNVRTSYGFIFGAYTIVVGALFIWQVLALYFSGTAQGFSGDHIFSRERVVDALSKIDLFFWLWIAGAIAGFILWEVFPLKQKPRKICPDLQYARLIKRLPAAPIEGAEKEYADIYRGRKVIFALRCAAWALFSVACVYGIVYLAIPSNFPKKDVTAEMLNFVKNVFPCIFAGLIVICAAAVYEKFAVKSMLPAVKKVTAGQPVAPASGKWAQVAAFLNSKNFILAVRIALAVLAVALIIWGALNGNARGVLYKAILICTECIGLG